MQDLTISQTENAFVRRFKLPIRLDIVHCISHMFKTCHSVEIFFKWKNKRTSAPRLLSGNANAQPWPHFQAICQAWTAVSGIRTIKEFQQTNSPKSISVTVQCDTYINYYFFEIQDQSRRNKSLLMKYLGKKTYAEDSSVSRKSTSQYNSEKTPANLLFLWRICGNNNILYWDLNALNKWISLSPLNHTSLLTMFHKFSGMVVYFNSIDLFFLFSYG